MAEKFTVKNFDQEVLSSPIPVLVELVQVVGEPGERAWLG